MPQEMIAQFPYIQFYQLAVEDREATLDVGHPQYKNVDMAKITSIGSKDTSEQLVDNWLATAKAATEQGRLPSDWYNKYLELYKNWKKGVEVSPTGTDLKFWPGINAGQLATCHTMKIFTLEQLAALPEGSVRMLGMGGMELRNKAAVYLAEAASKGTLAEQLGAAASLQEGLTVRIKNLEARLQMYEEHYPDLKQLGAAAQIDPTTLTPSSQAPIPVAIPAPNKAK